VSRRGCAGKQKYMSLLIVTAATGDRVSVLALIEKRGSRGEEEREVEIEGETGLESGGEKEKSDSKPTDEGNALDVIFMTYVCSVHCVR
jgi:hypothetical protein